MLALMTVCVYYVILFLFIVFGLLTISASLYLAQRPFHERWKMIEKEVIEPRNYERCHIYQSKNPYYRYELEPFRVCFMSSRQIFHVL